MMFVKICGITNREDAMAAVDAGARAVGFIFVRQARAMSRPSRLEAVDRRNPSADLESRRLCGRGARKDRADRARNWDSISRNFTAAKLPTGHPRGLRIWKAFRVEGRGHAGARLSRPKPS